MQTEYPIEFGKYTLLRRIAVGGMAEVFQAKLLGPKGFEKKLAIKRILPEFSQDDEFVEMFVDEARISSQFHHSNIVQVYDFGQVDHRFYLAMELVDGTNLKNLFFRSLKQKRAISRPLIYYVISRVASALDYAHKMKIEGQDDYLQLVHRDVSPQNVLISRRGEVKLTDFGIAKATIKMTQTQPGKIQGKYSYMSPEQALGKKIDHRSDIFSLGIIFFELMTGKKVYGSSDSIERYQQATKANIPRLGSIIEDIPSEVESLVMEMLSKDPVDRPVDGNAIVLRLAPFFNQIPEDTLTTELGELTKDLFPPSPEEVSENSRKKPFSPDPTRARSDIEWQGSSLEPSQPETNVKSTTPLSNEEIQEPSVSKEITLIESTVKRLVETSIWIKALGLMLFIGLLTLLFYQPWFDMRSETTAIPKPIEQPIVDVDPPADPKPDTLALEMELAGVENEIDAIESQIQALKNEAATTVKPKPTPKDPTPKPVVEKAPACPKGMRQIPSGEFLFGSSLSDPDRQALIEKPFQKVTVQGFCIDQYEYPNTKGQMPQTNVDFSQAQQICRDQGKNLCSDIQWERACKGPSTQTNYPFPYGTSFENNTCHAQITQPGDEPLNSPVESGSKPDCKTSEGVMDLSGNVTEWTSTQGLLNAQSYISKGGSFASGSYATRCSSIQEWSPDTRSQSMGLRCCKNL